MFRKLNNRESGHGGQARKHACFVPLAFGQVKYAIVKESDPFYEWFGEWLGKTQRFDPLADNRDEHVCLERDDVRGCYMWRATDAIEKADWGFKQWNFSSSTWMLQM